MRGATRGIMAGVIVATAFASFPVATGSTPHEATRAALPPGAIEHVLVIDLENENFDTTFGASSPARYLNTTLLSLGELVVNYFATSHASLGNYLSQVSGQAPTPMINNDCVVLSRLPNFAIAGGFEDVLPGTDVEDSRYPGQVLGDGCIFPAPTAVSRGVRTIADQLDEEPGAKSNRLTWRQYSEDMGNSLARDGGFADPLGGSDCAHPSIGGIDTTNVPAVNDQYANRHNPFIYFHSIIDDPSRCAAHVVPLGTLIRGVNGNADAFEGHLAEDLGKIETTPRFAFITPNVCNDGHDATCVGLNVEGTHAGGLVAADLWLKHWMPLILGSPAYRSGKMLVVLTFDEAGGDARACCNERGGPNHSNPGYSPLLGLFGFQTPPAPGTFPYPGGGQVGAVLFNAKYVRPGTINTSAFYNHYSALRSYEDLLGITTGGDDGQGHLGFAAAPDLLPFGTDVFNAFPGSGVVFNAPTGRLTRTQAH
jgi:hypothetical protein